MKDETQNLTHFGFETVTSAEKTTRVHDVFERIASRYDLMNNAMSLGWHHIWKNTFVDMLSPTAGNIYLDVAGGTGDIAFRILKRTHEPHNLIISDINPDMLKVGQQRAIDKGFTAPLKWVCADAENLTLPDSAVDFYTISFGLRNVTNPENAIRDAYRVLKPGGRFMCLEFSQVDNAILKKIYDAYSFHLIPKIGEWLADDKAAYQYLVESIRQFMDAEKFVDVLQKTGFSNASCHKLNGGIVAIHSGWKI